MIVRDMRLDISMNFSTNVEDTEIINVIYDALNKAVEPRDITIRPVQPGEPLEGEEV